MYQKINCPGLFLDTLFDISIIGPHKLFIHWAKKGGHSPEATRPCCGTDGGPKAADSWLRAGDTEGPSIHHPDAIRATTNGALCALEMIQRIVNALFLISFTSLYTTVHIV